MNAPTDSILFIPPKGLAGAAQSLAAAREVRRVHRKARITCLTTAELAPLFEGSPYFNAVDAEGDPPGWKEALALIKRLRGVGFSMGYDFRGSQLTARLYGAMKPRPLWSGPAGGASHRYSPPEGAKLHPLERMEQQLIAAGVLSGATGLKPDMSWLTNVGRRTRTLEPAYFGLNDHYAVLLPCSAARGERPALKPDEWAALASALLEQGLRPVVLGSVSDRDAANAVRHAAPQAKEFLGRTNLLQLAALARHSALTVSALAAPAHLAAAAAADVVTVFTAGDPDPVLAAPRGEGSVVALTPATSRVSVGDVMQSARALGAFRKRSARVDA